MEDQSTLPPAPEAKSVSPEEGEHVGARERTMVDAFREIYSVDDATAACLAYRAALEEHRLAELKVRQTFEVWNRVKAAKQKQEKL